VPLVDTLPAVVPPVVASSVPEHALKLSNTSAIAIQHVGADMHNLIFEQTFAITGGI